MLINHDTRCALDCVVDLVNSAPQIEGREGLGDVARLRAFVERHKVSDVARLDHEDIGAVHAVRARFTQVFAAPDDPSAVAVLNEMIAEAGTTPGSPTTTATTGICTTSRRVPPWPPTSPRTAGWRSPSWC